VKQLADGEVDVLICSVIFNEGLDVPAIRSVVCAAGGKSVIAAIQRMGRGMRVTADKGEFYGYDFYDLGCGCVEAVTGDTHMGCNTLNRHSKLRMNAFIKEGYKVEVV
jgi:Lhr-like helicase